MIVDFFHQEIAVVFVIVRLGRPPPDRLGRGAESQFGHAVTGMVVIALCSLVIEINLFLSESRLLTDLTEPRLEIDRSDIEPENDPGDEVDIWVTFCSKISSLLRRRGGSDIAKRFGFRRDWKRRAEPILGRCNLLLITFDTTTFVTTTVAITFLTRRRPGRPSISC